MSEIIIRHAAPADIYEVTELEKQCFPEAEAAKREAFALRLEKFPETFWVMEIEGRIICMINGMPTDSCDLCDEMYEGTKLYSPAGQRLMLFGVAAAPEFQGKGYASRLMQHVIEETKRCGRKEIVLTCKAGLIPFYQRFGYVSEGVSQSEHGGAEWYQMRLNFREELFRCARSGGEYSFYIGGRQYLLYGWVQCDGLLLNVSGENGELVWQSAGRSWNECAERFIEKYIKNDLL